MRARADVSGALNRRIIDTITTGETSLFRDIGPFDALRPKVLPELIDRRRRGLHSAVEMSRGLPASVRDRYFVPRGDGWPIRAEIRALASFRNANLMKDLSTLGRSDLIFCRNVAIYFSEADRTDLFPRIERSLERGGYLIIGALASLNGVNGRASRSGTFVQSWTAQRTTHGATDGRCA